MTKRVLFLIVALFLTSVISAQTEDNKLTSKELKQGWKLLFNGQNLDGWTSVGTTSQPSKGWTVEGGVLTVNKGGDKKGGDIISTDQYSSFDLRFDFLLTKGANGGVKYFFYNYPKGGWLGNEYQVLDDENHPDAKLGRNGDRKTASLYDMIPAGKKHLNPVGDWNHGRVLVKGNKVTHFLNGKKTLSYDRTSKSYVEAWKLSKFKNSNPMFGSIEKGYIMLQDHHDQVSFKNIKIKEL